MGQRVFLAKARGLVSSIVRFGEGEGRVGGVRAASTPLSLRWSSSFCDGGISGRSRDRKLPVLEFLEQNSIAMV